MKISESKNNSFSSLPVKHRSHGFFHPSTSLCLTINQPNDIHEQEADAIADKVMRMEDTNAAQVFLQRKEMNGEKMAKTFEGHLGDGDGQPLPYEVRRYYEPKFGYDFSDIRMHTNTAAAKSAQSINSLAYTIGHNIVFDQEQFSPHTSDGKKTLAHELAHVVQQRSQNNIPAIQRRVRTTRVNNCAPHNPFQVERRAVQLLTGAIDVVNEAIANRDADPGNAAVAAVRTALWTAFRFGNTDIVWNSRLPVILRRMESVRTYIESVVFQYECCPVGACLASTCGLTCDADDNAFTCDGNPVLIVLCPHLWTIGDDGGGRTIAHEVFHLGYQFIGDWDQPDFLNAHCYAHFMLLLNGINPPPERRCH